LSDNRGDASITPQCVALMQKCMPQQLAPNYYDVIRGHYESMPTQNNHTTPSTTLSTRQFAH